jgi:hypothetical protein
MPSHSHVIFLKWCCSLVDGAGEVVYDTFVAPLEPVTDYRTRVRCLPLVPVLWLRISLMHIRMRIRIRLITLMRIRMLVFY